MGSDVGTQVRLGDAHSGSETMGGEITRLDPSPNTALGDAQEVRDVANAEKPKCYSNRAVAVVALACHETPRSPCGEIEAGVSLGSALSQATASSWRTIERRPAFVTTRWPALTSSYKKLRPTPA